MAMGAPSPPQGLREVVVRAQPLDFAIERPLRLSRLATRAGLVTLRQTFVRRSHGGNFPCRGVKDEQWNPFSPEI
jgi:hypothetical protein